MSQTVSFEDLCQIEPRLLKLLLEAQAVRPTPYFCANEKYYGTGLYKNRGLKRQIESLVGWDARTNIQILGSSVAYDVVVDTIWHALPPCRNCGCL